MVYPITLESVLVQRMMFERTGEKVMAKLYYWVAECAGSDAYSIIGKTKKEAIAKLDAWGENWKDNFDNPVRKVIVYKDAFDLFDKVSGEGGGRSNAGRDVK